MLFLYSWPLELKQVTTRRSASWSMRVSLRETCSVTWSHSPIRGKYILPAVLACMNLSLSKRFAQKCLLSTFNSFTTETKTGKENYTYVFQVCGDADGLKNAGLVQRDMKGNQVRIGNYNSTQAVKGSK